MSVPFAFLDLSTPDLIIILAIILLLFGSKNLPKLTKSLSDSVRELRSGFSDNASSNSSNTNKKDGTKKDKSA
ncbi:MAG TPA: twin-arginine translocase TatA/TatE family subunit [Candidatus Saccharimonadales bacterium]|nr:twin-arginine translocase TatA/TatE family subunit [Candidatus Saccharimonadales bacterium]